MASSGQPVPPATSARLSLWRLVRSSLRGEPHDYTTGDLNRAVFLLAVPMVLEMVMESLFAVVDVFWVSRLGRSAVAVVGLTESVMSLVYAVALGLSFAATAIVARRIGEKDAAGANAAAGQILLLGLGVSAAIGVLLGCNAANILRWMGAEPATVALGTPFAQVMFGGNATVFLIFLLNAVFRGAGDAALAMRTLWLANALNIVLDPCLIFGWGPFPELGVTGAAVATNIGRGVGVLYQLWHLAGRGGRVRVRWPQLRPDRDLLGGIAATARNGVAQLLISTTSWVGLFKILALFGDSALAGYTVAIRLVNFALMPAWGLANAAATLVGQNLGADRPERAEAATRIALRWNIVVLALVGVGFVVFARPLAGAFTSDPGVLDEATRSLWIVSLAFPLYAAGMCFEAAFNGAGDTWTPTRLNCFCLWLGQVPLAWLLGHGFGLGPLGVYLAVPVSFSVLALWSAVLFRRGRWKLQRV